MTATLFPYTTLFRSYIAVRNYRVVRNRIGEQGDPVMFAIVDVDLVYLVSAELTGHRVRAVEHQEISITTYRETLKALAGRTQGKRNVLLIGQDFRFIRQAVIEKDIAGCQVVIIALHRHRLGTEEHDPTALAVHVRCNRVNSQLIGAGNAS